MSESFEDVMRELRKKAGVRCAYNVDECDKHKYGADGFRCGSCIEDVCGRLEQAHERELELAREPQRLRGHEDGRRSMDAKHYAVALRLQDLEFDGGSHENLSKIAYAIYPCATGWTCESSKGLRDELVRLLVGDQPTESFGSYLSQKSVEAMGSRTEDQSQDDTLMRVSLKAKTYVYQILTLADILGVEVENGAHVHEIGNAVIARARQLTGECNFSGAKSYMDTEASEPNPAETHEEPSYHVSFGTRSVTNGTCPNNDQTPSITDELRECVETGTKLTDMGDLYRLLKSTLGDAKRIHDKFVAQDRRNHETRERAVRLAGECRMYRTMLNDAAKEYSEQETMLDLTCSLLCQLDVPTDELDVYRPFQHRARVYGADHDVVFANVEIRADELPDAIDVAGALWVRSPTADVRVPRDGD